MMPRCLEIFLFALAVVPLGCRAVVFYRNRASLGHFWRCRTGDFMLACRTRESRGHIRDRFALLRLMFATDKAHTESSSLNGSTLGQSPISAMRALLLMHLIASL